MLYFSKDSEKLFSFLSKFLKFPMQESFWRNVDNIRHLPLKINLLEGMLEQIQSWFEN